MKVVFLDIDGPMIPAGQYLIHRQCSHQRIFAQIPLAVLNEFCKRSEAKIVLNTTHNRPIDGVPDIQQALVNAGISPDHFHPTDPQTAYPAARRGQAVKDWLAQHPEITGWVAFDDSNFTDDENLILIDLDEGLNVRHMNMAFNVLGVGKPFIVL